MAVKDAITGTVVVIGTIVIVALLIAVPVWFLWNLVMPDIFGLCEINLKQALCLSLLCKCLFWCGGSSKKKD